MHNKHGYIRRWMETSILYTAMSYKNMHRISKLQVVTLIPGAPR